jgi:hypothetical protein
MNLKHQRCGHEAQLYQHGWLGLLPCATCWNDTPSIVCMAEGKQVAEYRRTKGSPGWMKRWSLVSLVKPEARA